MGGVCRVGVGGGGVRGRTLRAGVLHASLERRLEERLDQRLSGIEAAIHDIADAVRAVDRRLAAIEGGEPADKQRPGAAA